MEIQREPRLAPDCRNPEHDGLRRLVQHLNHLYTHEPAFYELDDTYEGFEWIDFGDADNSVISFARKSRGGDVLLFVVNATPVVREGYRVGAPGAGFYQEILNTDAQTYGGSNAGNCGGMHAEELCVAGPGIFAQPAPAAAERGRFQTAGASPRSREANVTELLPRC